VKRGGHGERGGAMTGSFGRGPESILEGRMLIVAAVIVLVFSIFLLRLFQLQIVEGEILARRSQQNSIRTVRLEAPRGKIVDREGRVLATTRPAWSLGVVPSDLRDRDRTFAALEQLAERADDGWLAERVAKGRGARRHQTVQLLDDLSFVQLARLETHRYALPGVLIDVQPLRHYLQGDFAAHLLGSIGEIRAEQLESDRFRGYAAGEIVGQSGLESRLEPQLRGRAGGRNVVVDVAGREVGEVESVSPVPGRTVVLALDLDLQQAAEEGFLHITPGEPLQMGAAVALDVHTGDVLAVVSRPAYDPNLFAGGIDSTSWRSLTDDPWKPLRDRAIQNHYPPGSTYKAIVAAALLEEGVVTPETRVFCPGYFRFGRRNYRCWKREGHGWVDLRLALKRSCDVFFYQNGVKLGIDRLARYAKSFQLGQRTGIDLPGEVSGLVPSSEWKERRLGEPWYPGETISAAIGQGYNLMTPLQLALSYAAIANGGTVIEPRLVLRVEAPGGRVIERFESVEIGHVPVAPERLAMVRDGLTAVVEEPGGTGGRARVPGMKVAGKTGTAQVVRLERTEGLEEDEIPIRHRDHAWFGAFAPADDPRIAVAVFVEHGRHGSSAAAPIAQRILARWLAKQEPTGDEEEPGATLARSLEEDALALD
jgi:penicillin-binding protein 2